MNKQWMQFAERSERDVWKKDFVPLHEPTFNEKEVEYVTDCIKTGWVSSVGAYVTRFEEGLSKVCWCEASRCCRKRYSSTAYCIKGSGGRGK